MTATEDFHRLADRAVDFRLRLDPVSATWLGDHRFDGMWPDQSHAAEANAVGDLDRMLAELDAVDDVELAIDDFVDLEILRSQLMRTRFELEELRSSEWNPLSWNPGTGLHLLVSREFAPADERRVSALGRLAGLPDYLQQARHRLGDMPSVHVETALGQLAGTAALIDGQIRELVGDGREVDDAARAVAEFRDWLPEQRADRDPRLGQRLYAAALWHALDDDVSAHEVLADATEHLEAVGERMREAAAEYLGIGSADDTQVREALAQIARENPVDDSTVLGIVEQAVMRAGRFVRDHDIVSIPDLAVDVIEMPEIHRGVAVAYCDAPGPLETAILPTFVAVSPTPAGWTQERIASFYREYNAVQLHDLTIHEALPGHVLQLAHARSSSGSTAVRRMGMSGVFVEGWAVYAEELMLDRGYLPDASPKSGPAIRLQQLKMQARMAINAILDVRVHSHELDEDEAIALMLDRGFQEEGEAVGKWRRALLTATQLPTYFVGYRSVASIAADLRVVHPNWGDAQVHDLMLGHGSPPPRHLRTLLGL